MFNLGALLESWTCRGLAWFSRGRVAPTSGTLRLRGLRAPVEIIRDRWGVPHIYAENTHDVLFAQGFVHAQDRLWQMDFQRRVASGRLSEVLGQTTLAVDRWVRIIGLRRAAERDAAQLAEDVRPHFAAYVDGVNAWIAQGALPVEFTLLRYRPQPWTVADTLVWTKMVAWNLSVNWESEILRAQLIDRLGPELAAELEPAYCGHWPVVVPPGVDYAAIGRTAQAHLAEARPVIGPPAQEGLGSNDWVLAGSRTASGAPIVANDLHQLMGLPCIWYENHLAGGDLHATGCTFPGALGVLSGHNDQVAWGLSNGFADVQDLYVERLRHSEDGRVQYEYQDEWLDAQVFHERIGVRGKRAVVEEVIVTRHGPIINALAPAVTGEQPLALRWTCLEPETIGQANLYMDQARNCREFHEALRYWTSPAQHMVYADREGNIGYTYPGRVPVRAKGQGQVPVPGWTGEYEWTGYIPFEELPHAYNPPQGYVASANNRVVGEDYPYHISCDYCSGDRAQRICELIEAGGKIDVPYVQRMQLDLVTPGARTLAGYVGRLSVQDPTLATVVGLMREWDGELAAGSPAAAVLEVLVPRLLHRLLGERLGDLAPRYMGQGPNPVLADGSLLGFRAWEWLQMVLAEPESHWFDLGGGEGRDGVLLRALQETVAWLQGELGPDPQGWAWGRLHTLTYAHTLGRVRPLGRFLNRGPFPLGGDYTTVCATGSTRHREENGEASIGPSFRIVNDLDDWRHSLAELVPGQSGQPGSPHYDDQVAGWFQAQGHPLLYTREDVEREAEARLSLRPG